MHGSSTVYSKNSLKQFQSNTSVDFDVKGQHGKDTRVCKFQ